MLLRENPELVKRSQEARGESPETVDAALEADRARRAAITAFEELRAAQNAHGKKVAQAPKEEKAALVAEAKHLSERVKQAQHAVAAAEEASAEAFGALENIVIEGVPAGGEDDFVTLRTGTPSMTMFSSDPKASAEEASAAATACWACFTRSLRLLASATSAAFSSLGACATFLPCAF